MNKRQRALPILIIPLILATVEPLRADSLDELARDFWAWRTEEEPLSGDDIPRIERPAGWTPDWSPRAVEQRRRDLVEFEKRWKAMDPSGWPVAKQVDYRLMGSAIERVRWELEVTRGWQRNPEFYVEQTLGAVFDLLRRPPPFGPTRTREIVRRMESIPKTVEGAEANLKDPPAPFAKLAMDSLTDARGRLDRTAKSLAPLLEGDAAKQLAPAAERAAGALESYRAWLDKRLPSMRSATAIGRNAYIFFLENVALMPFTPDELVEIGKHEWARAVAFQIYEEHRNRDLPELMLPPTAAAQTEREAKDEAAVRRFLEVKGILTVPAWMHHYRTPALPDYLEPLSEMGVTDDLTGPDRLDEDGTSYIPPPSPSLPYFALATARDPRVMIVHEGIPGHYFQLASSWANKDPIRRHYYDSGANEGIAFYAEEMMLEAGLFDDSPRSREIIDNFARLRALRVEVDVKLALGEFTIDRGAAYLEKNVPMDVGTARSEASSFAVGPGQAISYQIGKLQILEFLAEARRLQGERFSLRAFHDFLWQNGNIPIALQRWEYLGLKNEVPDPRAAVGKTRIAREQARQGQR